MSWRDEVYKIEIIKRSSGKFPFEIVLYNKSGERVYSPPLTRTGDEAWKEAEKLQRDIGRSVLCMFVIDESLKPAAIEFKNYHRK